MTTIKTKKVIVEVPHRITGFFEIVDKFNGVPIKEPEKIGSRGGGFTLSAVGKTELTLEESDKTEITILINGEKLNQKAVTSQFIFDYVKKFLKNTDTVKVKARHDFDLPVGCGYGASGAGALGMSFGLNRLLNLKLPSVECGRIAHIAEVINKTGLGTVCGQLAPGLVILKEPGYPCVHQQIEVPIDLRVICGTFGMILTRTILSDPELSARIKEAGKIAVNKLIGSPSLENFIKFSTEFVKNTNLLSLLNLTKTNELMESLNKLDIYGASMNQLGRSIFAFCRKREEKKVIETFESFKPDIKIYNLSINTSGNRFL